MMNALITFFLTVIILGGLLLLFMLSKPYYRVDKAKMIKVLELVLTGQATENDWRLTFDITIRHSPELEAVRQRCCDIEEQYFTGEYRGNFIFSPRGLDELKMILEELRQGVVT